MRFTTFFPMNFLLRISVQFDQERILISHRSLILETQREIQYSEISSMELGRRSDMSWANAGFFVLLVATLIVIWGPLLPVSLSATAALSTISRLMFCVGFALHLPSLPRRDYCLLYDSNHRYLTQIRLTAENGEDVYAAIELIRARTRILSETYYYMLESEEAPRFELTVDYPASFLKRNVMRFYADRVIDAEKSWTEESAQQVRYDALAERVEIVKLGDTEWTSLGWNVLFLGFFLGTALHLFGPDLHRNPWIGPMIIGTLVAIPMFLMRYVKNEFATFYYRSGHVAFVMKIPAASKPKVSDIIEFVKSKVNETLGAG